MMAKKSHRECIELLLASITLTVGDDGLRHSFLFGEPGAREHEKRQGITIYHHPVEMTLAALHLRSVGPSYLKALPLDELSSKLSNFLSDNFGIIGDTVFFNHDERPFSAWISEEEKYALASALAQSELFLANPQLNLFPLVPIKVTEPIILKSFFLVSSDTENAFQLDAKMQNFINPKIFPPLTDFQGKPEFPTSWLVINSPDLRAAKKLRSSILGAISLSSLDRHRHMFSGRKVFGGQASISNDGVTHSLGRSHTPPCMYDIILGAQDYEWLKIIDEKITLPDKDAVRQLKSLEYFYRAWPLDPEERFPILCMATDALFGDANNATQAVIDGVSEVFDGSIDEQQLRAIMNLRASVIHGGAPDVYDSRKYAKYYKNYKSDPISDLELVVAYCLKKKVLEGRVVEAQDPDATIIAEAQAAGKLPKSLHRVSILNPISR